MLTKIRTFFEQHLVPLGEDSREQSEHRLRLAVAALLLEMTRMDEQVRPEECASVEGAVRDHFGLTLEESNELMELADAQRREATDYYQFTSLINDHYGPEQRVQVIEHLWRIAYADQVLHHHEEHLVRKIAELLHVSHGAFIAAKHRAAGGG